MDARYEGEPEGSLRKDGSRKLVVPADVHGPFTSLRRWVFVVLGVIALALPSIRIGGHPAVLLDVEHRRFYLFGTTGNAQDFWLVFFVITGVVFALVVVTALWGRVWCGYACPQTVFLEGFYRRVERWLEGSRDHRLSSHRDPGGLDRLWRKGLKHLLFAAFSIFLAHVALSYFVAIPDLSRMLLQSPANHPEAFAWMAGLSVVAYLNFAWFREQLCLIVCPYGRLQSVLTDDDSVVIGYDALRGEPRGKAARRALTASRAGDCVDCRRCVVVCPTAIDIRAGQQLECIGCAACVDACDEIMVKLGKPKGLIRYDSVSGLSGKKRRVWRSRLALYGILGLVGLAASGLALASRSSIEATLLRAPGDPFTVTDGVVRNVLDLHVVNKTPGESELEVVPRSVAGMTFVLPVRKVTLASLEGAHVPIVVEMPIERVRPGTRVVVEVVSSGSGGDPRRVEIAFVAPVGRGGSR